MAVLKDAMAGSANDSTIEQRTTARRRAGAVWLRNKEEQAVTPSAVYEEQLSVQTNFFWLNP
jgi:hypothetical protein